MQITSSSRIYKTLYYNGYHLQLFCKRQWQSFQISYEQLFFFKMITFFSYFIQNRVFNPQLTVAKLVRFIVRSQVPVFSQGSLHALGQRWGLLPPTGTEVFRSSAFKVAGFFIPLAYILIGNVIPPSFKAAPLKDSTLNKRRGCLLGEIRYL